jgi:hypothetical protein
MLSPGRDERPRLAATIAPLRAGAGAPTMRDALAWMARIGLRGVQFDATAPETRARELPPSARRDLRATLHRNELACAGLDFFIPSAHYTDPVHVSRAFDALVGAIGLGADLGRVPVTAPMPSDVSVDLRDAVAAEASRLGVQVLLAAENDAFAAPAPFAASVDCAAVLAAGGRPEEVIARLGTKVGGVRVVDLLRSGLRGPILAPHDSRLDALAVRLAVELAGLPFLPVIDARQWVDPADGISQTVERWGALRPMGR